MARPYKHLTRDRVRSPEDALAYVTDCTLATIDSYPKSGSKSELKRQISIAQCSIDWMRQMDIEPSGRAVDVIEKFEGSVQAWNDAGPEGRYGDLLNPKR
jgi:hypothetical protein